MHDIQFIRKNPEAFDEGMKKRGVSAQSPEILALDEEKRAKLTELQELQSKRNQFAKAIGQAKAKGEDTTIIMTESKATNERIVALEAENSDCDVLTQKLASLPNIPAEGVPLGSDETGNVEIRAYGAKPAFAFIPKEHFDLGEKLGLMDFERAAKLSGARFVVLKGQLAKLERALANFFLDTHTKESGYTEVSPPLLVKDNAMFGTGQLPKFGEDLFKTTTDHWLIPTAEVSLTNLVADEILNEADLPYRFTAFTPCFRSEAGSAGKDTRGMIRQHQFSKVEMVGITHPDKSDEEHERMTKCAEGLLQKLGLHYRVMLLCSGDMGFCARKTYDIEVWLPGQNAYREISSCSNCGDFQARRMKARFRPKDSKATQFVHTLNGSGLPLGRTMVAILENYQQEDGSIIVPEVLRPYMDGLEVLGLPNA
jgi:seryl-tRNA synthetase